MINCCFLKFRLLPIWICGKNSWIFGNLKTKKFFMFFSDLYQKFVCVTRDFIEYRLLSDLYFSDGLSKYQFRFRFERDRSKHFLNWFLEENYSLTNVFRIWSKLAFNTLSKTTRSFSPKHIITKVRRKQKIKALIDYFSAKTEHALFILAQCLLQAGKIQGCYQLLKKNGFVLHKCRYLFAKCAYSLNK